MTAQPLNPELQPRLFGLQVPEIALTRLPEAQRELTEKARKSPYGTWLYAATLSDAKELPASRVLAANWPEIDLGRGLLGFSWLRYSHGRHPGPPGYHLDADGQTGVAINSAVDTQGVPTQAVWRLILNLHTDAERTFNYLDADPHSFEWRQNQGYIELASGQNIINYEKTLTLPKRVGGRVTGALVCVSQIAHAGTETKAGHFLASWSSEEAA